MLPWGMARWLGNFALRSSSEMTLPCGNKRTNSGSPVDGSLSVSSRTTIATLTGLLDYFPAFVCHFLAFEVIAGLIHLARNHIRVEKTSLVLASRSVGTRGCFLRVEQRTTKRPGIADDTRVAVEFVYERQFRLRAVETHEIGGRIELGSYFTLGLLAILVTRNTAGEVIW